MYICKYRYQISFHVLQNVICCMSSNILWFHLFLCIMFIFIMYFFVFFFSQGGGIRENMYFRYYWKMKIFKWLRFQKSRRNGDLFHWLSWEPCFDIIHHGLLLRNIFGRSLFQHKPPPPTPPDRGKLWVIFKSKTFVPRLIWIHDIQCHWSWRSGTYCSIY